MPWLVMAALGMLFGIWLVWASVRPGEPHETAHEKRRELRRIEHEYGHDRSDPNRKRD
jgi:hypothetical protein